MTFQSVLEEGLQENEYGLHSGESESGNPASPGRNDVSVVFEIIPAGRGIPKREILNTIAKIVGLE